MNLQVDPRLESSYRVNQTPTVPAHSKNRNKLRESTREFETMYIYEMYKAMRKNVPESTLFPQSSASKIFHEMLDMEMARKAAQGKGMGIGEAMYEQMKDKLPTP